MHNKQNCLIKRKNLNKKYLTHGPSKNYYFLTEFFTTVTFIFISNHLNLQNNQIIQNN